ncbi:hypothetical protein BJ508DRAFT_333212 [Ascobolus immersus RN42]|uniref:Uncharacterized protein n=1 Tax=Ascobolus immersus RN42 TaxID=1160509 RepID=A0A3N4HXA6_ASCIM|nr:hypothetical protein BJ508DRAFT_333212 [Ascobolus immersus RN42]
MTTIDVTPAVFPGVFHIVSSSDNVFDILHHKTANIGDKATRKSLSQLSFDLYRLADSFKHVTDVLLSNPTSSDREMTALRQMDAAAANLSEEVYAVLARVRQMTDQKDPFERLSRTISTIQRQVRSIISLAPLLPPRSFDLFQYRYSQEWRTVAFGSMQFFLDLSDAISSSQEGPELCQNFKDTGYFMGSLEGRKALQGAVHKILELKEVDDLLSRMADGLGETMNAETRFHVTNTTYCGHVVDVGRGSIQIYGAPVAEALFDTGRHGLSISTDPAENPKATAVDSSIYNAVQVERRGKTVVQNLDGKKFSFEFRSDGSLKYNSQKITPKETYVELLRQSASRLLQKRSLALYIRSTQPVNSFAILFTWDLETGVFLGVDTRVKDQNGEDKILARTEFFQKEQRQLASGKERFQKYTAGIDAILAAVRVGEGHNATTTKQLEANLELMYKMGRVMQNRFAA